MSIEHKETGASAGVGSHVARKRGKRTSRQQAKMWSVEVEYSTGRGRSGQLAEMWSKISRI